MARPLRRNAYVLADRIRELLKDMPGHHCSVDAIRVFVWTPEQAEKNGIVWSCVGRRFSEESLDQIASNARHQAELQLLCRVAAKLGIEPISLGSSGDPFTFGYQVGKALFEVGPQHRLSSYVISQGKSLPMRFPILDEAVVARFIAYAANRGAIPILAGGVAPEDPASQEGS